MAGLKDVDRRAHSLRVDTAARFRCSRRFVEDQWSDDAHASERNGTEVSETSI
jgi:hypothetical protein